MFSKTIMEGADNKRKKINRIMVLALLCFIKERKAKNYEVN